MRFAIIVSKQDTAGINIAACLEEISYDKQKFTLRYVEDNQVFADFVNDFPEDFFIFASKHKSASQKPSLTCHAIGNWGKAELGGKDRTLVPASAFLLRNFLLGLQKQQLEKKLPFEVTLECVHHGPWLEKPAVFIEIGSSQEQWNDNAAGLAVAETIKNSTSLNCGSAPVPLTSINGSSVVPLIGNCGSEVVPIIGLGGTHYCGEFSKLVLRKNFAFSFICPEYALVNFDEEMLQKAIICSVEKPKMIVLDWKGLGKEKGRIVDLLSKQGLPVERVQRLLK